jgi:hypothetical protein
LLGASRTGVAGTDKVGVIVGVDDIVGVKVLVGVWVCVGVAVGSAAVWKYQ